MWFSVSHQAANASEGSLTEAIYSAIFHKALVHIYIFSNARYLSDSEASACLFVGSRDIP